jgi:hypothetical protein
MNNLTKLTTFIIVNVIVISAFSGDTSNSSFKTTLPRIELELNTGWYFFVQLKPNININDNLFITLHASKGIRLSELGFSTGYQFQYSKKGRLQLGAGYAHVINAPILPIFAAPDGEPKYWDGLKMEVDLIQYFIRRKFGMNIGLNITYCSQVIYLGNIYPDINLGFIFEI